MFSYLSLLCKLERISPSRVEAQSIRMLGLRGVALRSTVVGGLNCCICVIGMADKGVRRAEAEKLEAEARSQVYSSYANIGEMS